MGCGTNQRNYNDKSTAVYDSIIKVHENPESISEIIIYYGTQSGNSKEFSNELSKEAKEKYQLKTIVTDLADFDPKDLLNKKLVVFIVSTYGEGGPTDNAQLFYQWVINEFIIQKDKETFSNLKFAVFGCGDSSFTKTFNRMAKITEENLSARGAQKIVDTGLGDNNKNLNEDFLLWKNEFWKRFMAFFKIEASI